MFPATSVRYARSAVPASAGHWRGWPAALLLPVFLLALLVATAGSAAPATAPAGRVIVAVGEVTATDAAGSVRQLKRRDQVFSGEVLNTGGRGRAQVRFTDGSLLSLRPDTEMDLAEYSFTQPAQPDRTVMRLNRGGFRTITGSIGRSNRSAYRVSTPLAVIGIRGTVYAVAHVAGGATTMGVGQGAIDATSTSGDSVILGAAGFDGQFARVDPDGSIVVLETDPGNLEVQPDMEDEGDDEESDGGAEESDGSGEEVALDDAGGGDSGDAGAGTGAVVAVEINPNPAEQGPGTQVVPARLPTGIEAPLRSGATLATFGPVLNAPGRPIGAQGGIAAATNSFVFAYQSTTTGFGPGNPLANPSAFIDQADRFLFTGNAPKITDVALPELGIELGFFDGTASPLLLFSSLNNTFLQNVPHLLPFAVAPTADIANLTGTRNYAVTDFSVRTSQSAFPVEVFGELTANLDMGSGDVSGILDVVFGPGGGDGESSDIGSLAFIVDFEGTVNGPTINFNMIDASFTDFSSQNSVEQPATANLTGFFTSGGDRIVVGMDYRFAGTGDFAAGNALFSVLDDGADVRNALISGNQVAVFGPTVGGSLPAMIQGGAAGFFGSGMVFAYDSGSAGFGFSLADRTAFVDTVDRVLDFNGAPVVDQIFNAGGLGVTLGVVDGSNTPFAILDGPGGNLVANVAGMLPFLSGPSGDISNLTVSQSYVISDYVVRTSNPGIPGVVAGDLFAIINMGTGDLDGILDVALSGDNPMGAIDAEMANEAFLVDFTATIASGSPAVNFNVTNAVYQNMSGSVFEEPLTLAQLAGVVIGPAQGFGVAFNYQLGGMLPAFATGTALFTPGVATPPGALTPAEAAGFGSGFFFVGTECCDLDSGIGFGRALDARFTDGATVLGLNENPQTMDDALLTDPSFLTNPPAGLIRNGTDPIANFFRLFSPGASSVAVVEWHGFIDPVTIRDAETGTIVDTLNANVLFMTALPSNIADLSAAGSMTFGGQDVHTQAFFVDMAGLAAPVLSTTLEIQMDLGAGMINNGTFLVETQPGDGFAIDIAGQLAYSNNFPGVDATILSGTYLGSPIDIANSSFGFLVTGDSFSAFNLAGSFNLKSADTTPVVTVGTFLAPTFGGLTSQELSELNFFAVGGALGFGPRLVQGLASDLQPPASLFLGGVLIGNQFAALSAGGDQNPPDVAVRFANTAVVNQVNTFPGIPDALGLTIATFGQGGQVQDALSGVPVLGSLDQTVVAFGQPADPMLQSGVVFYQGTTRAGGVVNLGNVRDAGLGSGVVDAGVSLVFDYATGEVIAGQLAVLDFVGGGEDVGFFTDVTGTFDPAGNGSIDLATVGGTYDQSDGLGATDLSGFLHGGSAGAVVLGYRLDNGLGDVSAAGALVVTQVIETRLNGIEVRALDRVGIATFNPLDIGGAPASQFLGIGGIGTGQYFGRSTAAGGGSPVLTAGSANTQQLEFYGLPNQFVIRQGASTPVFTQADVTTNLSSVGSLAGAGFSVDWGIWNAAPGTEVVVQNDPANAGNQVLIDRDTVFLSVVPTDVASLVALGAVSYGGGTGVEEISFIGRGGLLSSPNVTNPLSEVDLALNVDFGSGDITNGQVITRFVNGISLINLAGTFDGKANGGLADLNLNTLQVFQDGLLLGPGDVINSSIEGVFTGPNGEAFATGFGLSGQGFHAEGAAVVGQCVTCR